MTDKVVETVSTTPVEQSSPTQTQPSTGGERKSESTKRSRTKSSGSKRRRKKKRETPPEGFDQWPEADQKYYQLRWAYHPTHNTEMNAYKKTLQEVIPLEKTENLDVDF
ncbi:unnamed protein product [Acanthocheilonema viteae]|uniref:Uncharacterized protein n=1 Tax=Acanthocheilonema viteae TaxID=6277 RepID=A0A498S237_ACAVI|nr:unnamed protein product [Acanthocheilonema viteae]